MPRALKMKGLGVSLKVLLLRVFKTFISHSDESLFCVCCIWPCPSTTFTLNPKNDKQL